MQVKNQAKKSLKFYRFFILFKRFLNRDLFDFVRHLLYCCSRKGTFIKTNVKQSSNKCRTKQGKLLIKRSKAVIFIQKHSFAVNSIQIKSKAFKGNHNFQESFFGLYLLNRHTINSGKQKL